MEKTLQSRRRFLLTLPLLIGLLRYRRLWALETGAPLMLDDFFRHNASPDPGNFRAIYLDDSQRADFLDFLVNVYHLYPENEFHSLIHKCAKNGANDAEIYIQIQKSLTHIKPFLGDLFYSFPALFKQKTELTKETLELLGGLFSNGKSINGFLEIGTTGRYVSELRHHLSLKGDLILINTFEPSYSPVDIAERGQLFKLGRYCPLDNYAPISESSVRSESLEVVANYIGFHHCPLDRLDAFVRSIARVIKKNGSLILRDHDVDSERMNTMVALAHDVFNAGLMVPWEKNHAELRYFRPLDQWIAYLGERGLQFQGKKILQAGDPTRNTLMEFRKI